MVPVGSSSLTLTVNVATSIRYSVVLHPNSGKGAVKDF